MLNKVLVSFSSGKVAVFLELVLRALKDAEVIKLTNTGDAQLFASYNTDEVQLLPMKRLQVVWVAIARKLNALSPTFAGPGVNFGMDGLIRAKSGSTQLG